MAEQALRPQRLITVFDTEVVAAGASATSDWIDVSMCVDGYSIYTEVTHVGATGEMTLEQLEGNDGTNFVTEETATLSAFTKTSGNDSNGKSIDKVAAPNSRLVKIKITETGAAEAITATVKIWGF